MNNPYDIIISRNENATSFVELNDQYNTLYNFLVNNQRQISYLDLYKITEYISTEAEGVQIGSKFAQLNPNTAIGIGVPSVKFNGETFYQGDLLLKLSNGQMQKLDAPSHGIYFPRWETEGKKLVWKYSKDEPAESTDETTSVEMTTTNNAESLLHWQIPSVDNSNGYGQKILRPMNAKGSWTTNIDSIKGLVPVIKCFNDSNEEILANITVTLSQESTTEGQDTTTEGQDTTTEGQDTTTKKYFYAVSNIPHYVSYLMVR